MGPVLQRDEAHYLVGPSLKPAIPENCHCGVSSCIITLNTVVKQ